MFVEERQKEIFEYIKHNGKIYISDITDKYNISDESARRDLRTLEQKGLCKRTHGGAIMVSQLNIKSNPKRDFSQMSVFPNYQSIAVEAIKHINQNDIVYLTSGSLGYIILKNLPKDISFTIVTNSVDLCQELRAYDNIETYVVGGKMRKSGSVVDSMALEFINKMRFDLCFITGSGLTFEFGLSNGTDETAAFQRAIIHNSIKKVLLIPSEKVGRNAFIKVCDAYDFDFIITDYDCNEDHLALFEERDIKIIVTKESP